MVVQTDGKAIVAGQFLTYNGAASRHIVRLNTNGTRDASFAIGTGFDYYVEALALQPDGKILVGGVFNNFNGTARRGIARLNANGTLDATFNPGASIGPSPNRVMSIALQPDGKIIIGGVFRTFNGVICGGIARLNANGTMDASFNPGTGFSSSLGIASIKALTLQPDGKILAGGTFDQYGNAIQNGIIRLNPNGSYDASFDIWGFIESCHAIRVLSNGRILIGGRFDRLRSTDMYGLACFNANGTLFTSFNPGTNLMDGPYSGFVNAIAVESSGKILAGGSFRSFGSASRSGIARFLPAAPTAIAAPLALTLSVWPNPASGHARLRSPEPLKSVIISTLAGQQLRRQEVQGPEALLDLKDLAPGLYMIEGVAASGQLVQGKLRVE